MSGSAGAKCHIALQSYASTSKPLDNSSIRVGFIFHSTYARRPFIVASTQGAHLLSGNIHVIPYTHYVTTKVLLWCLGKCNSYHVKASWKEAAELTIMPALATRYRQKSQMNRCEMAVVMVSYCYCYLRGISFCGANRCLRTRMY